MYLTSIDAKEEPWEQDKPANQKMKKLDGKYVSDLGRMFTLVVEIQVLDEHSLHG